MTPLHLNDLQCFVLVYELRSFSRAADAMDTVQSHVSTRIHRLERFAGTRLFARLPHGIRPTAGRGLPARQRVPATSPSSDGRAPRARRRTAQHPATRNQQQLSTGAEGEWVCSARSMWYFAEHAD
jgi:hypothetical protein